MNNPTANRQSTNLHSADVVICGAGIAGVSAAFASGRYDDPDYCQFLQSPTDENQL